MANGRIDIIEVSPRDGIQNEKRILSTETKLQLIRRAMAAGLSRIQVTSFVNPKRVPQMADAEAVCEGLPREGLHPTGLALNRRGFDRAIAAGLPEVNVAIVASETFSQRNQGATTRDNIDGLVEMAKDVPDGLAIEVGIAAAFGCPFEGEVPVRRIVEVVEGVLPAEPHLITLADTIGVATPRDVTERVGAVRRLTDIPIGLHLHNTRGTGIANAWAGIEAGVTTFDASLGGFGGCPFAPRATGNIATEDLVYMLERSGLETGVSLERAIETAEWLEAQLGSRAAGAVMRAGGFPAQQAA